MNETTKIEQALSAVADAKASIGTLLARQRKNYSIQPGFYLLQRDLPPWSRSAFVAGDLTHYLFGRRVDHRDRFAGAASAPFSVDEQ